MSPVTNPISVTTTNNSQKNGLSVGKSTAQYRAEVAAELNREATRAFTAARWMAGQGPTSFRRRAKWNRDLERWHVLDCEEYVVPARMSRQAAALDRAARAYVGCGLNFVYHECQPANRGADVHSQLTARYCMLATICPDCARRDTGRLLARYAPRIASALVDVPDGLRLRLVTAGLKPHGAEALTDAFDRCQPAFKSLLRICFGVPVSAREWKIYFQLAPLTDREKLDAGTVAKARKVRRARVRADLLRRGFGAIMASEFGERSMLAHCHALVLARFVEQRTLSRCWRLLTGDSFVVDVRLAQLGDAREVLKYAVKFTDRTPRQLAAIYRATCGRRRVEALGCFRGRCDLEAVAVWLRPKPMCEICGAPLRAVGHLPGWMHAMGLRAPPNERPYRFLRRPAL